MEIANYKIYPIISSRFALDGGAMFGVVPKTLWSKTNPADELNRIEMVTRNLLIVGENKNILVDTGNSSKMNEKLQNIYNLQFSPENLLNSLEALKLKKEDITDVILTHLHFDHTGGSTYLDGQDLRPTFPNATFYIQKKHFEYALNPTERDRASFIREDFYPLYENGQLELVDGELELFPNIFTIVVNGHTPSQQIIKITDTQKTILYCGDLIPMSSHIPLPYIMGYDLRPLETLEEKRKILQSSLKGNWILVFEHDPYVTACTIKQTEKGYTQDSIIDL